MTRYPLVSITLAFFAATLAATSASAHKLREKGELVEVAGLIAVTPSRDWNRLDYKLGKRTETWTLDGEQLNNVTFFCGIEAGKPLFKERNKKREPLPKFTEATLLVEVPELLEGTYRSYKGIGTFELLSAEPTTFLGLEGVTFTYTYTDADQLTRKGQARAAIVDQQLYMITFDAPRLHYYDRVVGDFLALADTAKLK